MNSEHMRTNAFNPMNSLRTLSPDISRLREVQSEFSGILAQTSSAAPDKGAQARKGAESLVATALVSPVLKQMRESTMAAAPFAPNSAERTFRAMQDAALAQRLVSSSRWKLVDAVAQRLLSKSSGAPAPVERLPGQD